MRTIMIQSWLLLCLLAVVLSHSVYAEVFQEKNNFDEYLYCDHTTNAEERISRYRGFISRYPKDTKADDALLKILTIKLETTDLAGAQVVLSEIEDNYPDGHLRQHLLLGDPDEKVVSEWRKFVAANPIRTSDWAKLLIARYHLEKEELSKAKDIVSDLLTRTERPETPADIHPDVLCDVLCTEEIRDNVLRLAWTVAKQSDDLALQQRVRVIVQQEYGVNEFALEGLMSLSDPQTAQFYQPIATKTIDSTLPEDEKPVNERSWRKWLYLILIPVAFVVGTILLIWIRRRSIKTRRNGKEQA